MSRYKKIRSNVLSGNCDKNILEADMKFFLNRIGAANRETTGSHM